MRLWEKSVKSLGNSNNQAKGTQASITTYSAGNMRLARLS